MARGNYNSSGKTTGSTGLEGPRFINWLLWQNVIQHRLFAFYMTDATHQSFIDIGGYSMSNALNPSATVNWIPVEATFFWTVSIDAYMVGD